MTPVRVSLEIVVAIKRKHMMVPEKNFVKDCFQVAVSEVFLRNVVVPKLIKRYIWSSYNKVRRQVTNEEVKSV